MPDKKPIIWRLTQAQYDSIMSQFLDITLPAHIRGQLQQGYGDIMLREEDLPEIENLGGRIEKPTI
jgi:hypothetical protein